MNSKIDFVITWVDGSDPKWIMEKNSYSAGSYTDNRTERFRDWDNLIYWFRGIEKFAPWVNRIHFVTWGHFPKWLNLHHPQLNIVTHSDYIPQKYLPTFNSHAIELNLHRIPNLTENFVYFNDDVFIISPTKSSDFFKNNLPCESAILNAHCYSIEKGFHLSPYRNIGIINKYFNMRYVIKKNPAKWFNLKYGPDLLRTLALLPCPRFPGLWQAHLASSLKKSTFETLWLQEYKELDETCLHKFRHMLDYNQWLFKEWQIASGEFFPRQTSFGKSFEATEEKSIKTICEFILKQKGKMISINDGEMTAEKFKTYKQKINNTFQKILPEKSKFEK